MEEMLQEKTQEKEPPKEQAAAKEPSTVWSRPRELTRTVKNEIYGSS